MGNPAFSLLWIQGVSQKKICTNCLKVLGGADIEGHSQATQTNLSMQFMNSPNPRVLIDTGVS